jgi:phytoene/squalene synthetase
MVSQVVSTPTHALVVGRAGFDGSFYLNRGAVARVATPREVEAPTTHSLRVKMTWRREAARCREWLRRRRLAIRSGPWWLAVRVTL